MTIKYSPSDKNRDAINKLIPGTPSAPQPDRWAEPQQAQPQRSNPPPILPLAPLQELQSGRWEVNASLPASWQPKENRPSYWSDPRRIGRYYHAIKALPENAFIPDWIDAPGIEAAYNYLKETRSGSWETWENVTDDDPLNTIIKSMPAPPPNFMPLWEQEMYRKRSEAEKAYQEQGYQPNPAAAEPMKAGLPASEFDKLPVWKQNTLRLMPILEYGMQGLGGAILGGVVGGVGGAIIGAPLMIGASYKAKQIQAAIDAGEKVTDAQKNFLNFFMALNVPAEELEKIGGFEAQIIYSLIDPDKYGEVHELFGNWENFFAAAKINPEVLTGKSQVLDSILKTGYAIAMGSSYLLKGGAGNGEMFENVGNTLEAGSIFYESLLSGKNTVDGKNLQDIAIEQDKVHGYKYMQDQVKSGKVDKNKTIIGYDISSLNDIYTEVPDQKAAQGWMMQEFRKRLENGESPNDVFLSMSNKFGFFGSMKELAGNVLLDPLDVIPMLGNATMWQIGVKTGNKALMEAFGGVKTKTITGVDGKIKNVPVEVFGKVNDPFIMNLRSYKNLVRQMPSSQAAQLSAISKWVAGMTDDGFIKDFAQQPSKKNVLNYLRGLTPAARSNQVLSSFVDGLYNLVAGETDPRIIKGLLHSLANMKPEDAIKSAEGYKIKIMVGGEAVETNIPGWYLSAEAQLLPNAMKDAMKSVDEIFDTFDLSNPQRSIIRRVAEYMTKTPAELIAELKKMTNGEADQMYSKFLLKLDAISRKGDTNAKKLLDLLTKTDEANKLTGAKLKEMAKQFYGKNAVPFDESLLKMKALLILEESISKWAVDWFGVKPLHPLLRMSNVIKRAQSALLLGFNPSYFFNNALNNLVTMSWDGLLKMGKFYKEQELIADFGMTPARMAQGSGAMDFGEVGAGMLKMLGMEPEPIGNAIRSAGRGKNKEGKIDKIQKVDDFLKAGDKIQVFAYLSQVMEKWSSRKAVVRGIQEFMNYSHIEGKGYTKMPDQLFMDLERIEPGLGKKVKKVIEGNFSKEKIEKLIWGDMGVNPSIRDVLDPAAKDMLDQLGILKEIEKDLAKAKTKDDVSAAFTKVRKAAQKEMSNVVRRNAMKLVEDAKLKAGIEKTQGVLDMIDQIVRLRTDFWLTHFEFMAKVAEDASQKKGASRWLTWENGKTEANTNWNTFATIEAAKYLGILDGLGLDKQSITYHNVVDNLLQQRNTWDGFFAKQQELFYKFQDEANAIENPKDRQALWYKMNEEINQHYLDAALKEDQLTLEMDQYFIDQYTKQFESKGQLATQEAKRWRDAINLERRRMIQAQMLYRTGMVPENMLAWGDLLSADIKKAIFDLTGFNPLHTFQRATRDKINPKFYQDIYTQFIRDMNQASNENAPGMPMPEPPITPEGSGTATTATTPPQGEGIPTMMTQKMRNDLSALGYLQEDIANMTPQQAWDVINNGQKKIITDATQPSMMKDPVGKTVKPRAVNEAETEIWAAIAEVKPELAGVDELGKINPEAKLNIIKWLNKHSSSARAKATLGDDGKRTLKWSDITPDDIRQAAATEKSIADASPSLFGDQTPPVTDVTPEQVTDVTPAAGETQPGTAQVAPVEEIIPIIDEYRARTNQIKAGETARQKYERLLEVRNQLETNLNEMINLLPAPRIGKEAAERVLYDVLGSKGRLDQYEAMRLIWEGFANSYAKANGGSPDDWYDQMIVTRGGSHGLNGKVIGQRMIDTKFFKARFGDSKVVDANGEPLMVYRGQHGSGEGVETKVGSITFSDLEAANLYAMQPNQETDIISPNVRRAYLSIENPIINSPDDPFIDLHILESALGREETIRIANKYADQIENTNNWIDEISPATGYKNVVDFLNDHPEQVRNLYIDAWKLLDDPEVVSKLKDAGFDGAIYGGVGETLDSPEYRVFSPEQIINVMGNGTLYQRNPDSINFRSWFRESKVLDEEGQALQVLHGTTRNFDAMDVDKTNQDNFVGRGLYFTDSMADVGNYSGIGADLNNRIEYQIFRLSESFNDDPYVYEDLLYAHFPDRADDILEGIDDLDFDDYRVLAEAQLMDHGGSVIPAYLRMEKPVYMGNPRGKRSSVIEYVFDLDDADNVIDEYFVTDHGDRVDLKGIIEDLGEQYYIQNVWDEFTQRADELFDGEISLTTIKKIFDEIFEGAVDEFSGELTHGGQIFSEFVQAAGYDGIMMNAELFFPKMEGTKGATHYIVFDPNQAKSVFNPDIFGVDDNRLLFQDEVSSLIALHNIYDHELISALELGGFPVPSIAITRGDIEFEGTGFGDVTLIGNRRMIDPRRDSRNRVFSADVWSPDFPREYWYPVKMADARKVGKRFYENFGAIDQQHEFWAIEDATLQNPSKPRLFEVLMGREGSKYTFLKEQGIEIEVPTRNRDLGDYAVYINETVFNWFKENYHAQSGKYEPEFVRGFSQVFKENLYEAIQNKYAGTGVDIDDMYRIRLETMFDPETGNLHWRQYDNMRSRLSKMIDEPIETDFIELTKRIKEAMKGKEEAHRAWAQEIADSLFDEPYIEGKNKKKMRLTLSNVVEVMTAQKVKNQQKAFTYNMSQARARSAKEFYTIDQMKEKIGNLATREDVKNFVDADVSKKLEKVDNIMHRHYKWSDGFEMRNDIFRAMGQYLAGKSRSKNAMESALYRFDFSKDLTDEFINAAMDAAKAIEKMPVNYFEAKPQRAVYPNEFTGAVIPKNASKELIKKLQEWNMEYKVYDPDVPGDRLAKVKEYHDREGVLFQRKKRGATRWAEDGTAILHAFEAADISTFLHETVHVFTPQMSIEHSEIIRSWLRTEHKMDLPSGWHRDPIRYRDASEILARGMEKYFSEGIAPSAKLRQVFESFKKWIVEIYRRIEGSEIDVKLNDNVRKVFGEWVNGGYVDELIDTNLPIMPDPTELTKLQGLINEERLTLQTGKFNGRKVAKEYLDQMQKSYEKHLAQMEEFEVRLKAWNEYQKTKVIHLADPKQLAAQKIRDDFNTWKVQKFRDDFGAMVERNKNLDQATKEQHVHEFQMNVVRVAQEEGIAVPKDELEMYAAWKKKKDAEAAERSTSHVFATNEVSTSLDLRENLDADFNVLVERQGQQSFPKEGVTRDMMRRASKRHDAVQFAQKTRYGKVQSLTIAKHLDKFIDDGFVYGKVKQGAVMRHALVKGGDQVILDAAEAAYVQTIFNEGEFAKIWNDADYMPKPEVPAEPAKIQTRDEFYKEQNTKYVEAIKNAISSGKKIQLRTYTNQWIFTKPDQIFVDKVGDVRMTRGKKSAILTNDQVDSLLRQAGVEFERKYYPLHNVEVPETPVIPTPPPVMEPKVKQTSPISISVTLGDRSITISDTRDGWVGIHIDPKTKEVINSPQSMLQEPMKVVEWAKSMLKGEKKHWIIYDAYDYAEIVYRGYKGSVYGTHKKGDALVVSTEFTTKNFSGRGKVDNAIDAWKKMIDEKLDGKAPEKIVDPEPIQQDIFSTPAQPEVATRQLGSNEITSVKDISKGQYDKLVTYREGLKGQNDNKLVAYQHIRKQGEKYSVREEGMVGAKVSDMENAKKCSTCDRKIVHVFYVQDTNGIIRPYGSEHLHEALGYKTRISDKKKNSLIYELENGQKKVEGFIEKINYRKKPSAREARLFFFEHNKNVDVNEVDMFTNGTHFIVNLKNKDNVKSLFDEVLEEQGFYKVEPRMPETPKNIAAMLDTAKEYIGWKVSYDGVEDIILDARVAPDGSTIEYVVWRDGEIITHQTPLRKHEMKGKATPEEMQPGLDALNKENKVIPGSENLAPAKSSEFQAEIDAELKAKIDLEPAAAEFAKTPEGQRIIELAWKQGLEDAQKHYIEAIETKAGEHLIEVRRRRLEKYQNRIPDDGMIIRMEAMLHNPDAPGIKNALDAEIKSLVEPVNPIKETPAEVNVWNKKKKPVQTTFFGSGEDTPLFSGVAQKAQEEQFTPQEVAPQDSLFDMREQLPTIEGKNVTDKPSTEGSPLFGDQQVSKRPLIDKLEEQIKKYAGDREISDRDIQAVIYQRYAGEGNVEIRRQMIAEMTGQMPPKSQAGVAIVEAKYKQYSAKKTKGTLYQDAVQKDKKTFALDAGQNRYEFEYKIVSLDDLITSHTDAFGENPKYPQELQPRLRGRAAGQEQVNKIAAELKPEGYVADFHTTDRGAPIIGNDLVVESGNGRTMALRKAKAAYPEKYAAYQEAVKIAAEEYGLSVEGINDPVLVRERITDVDRAKFAEDANVESSAGMSSIENARKDIKYISDELLSNFNVAEKQTVEQALRKIENQSLVRSFVDQLPESEKGRMMDAKGALSIDGAARIKNAMILKIYPDDAGMRLLTAFAESLDEGTTNIQKVLYNTLGEMAMLEGAVKTGKIPADLSIAEDVSKAVDVYTRLRQENTSVSDYLAQQSFFEKELDDFQGEMLRFIDKNRRSPNKLRELISQYIQEAMKQPPAGQESMFTPRTTKGEILDAVTKRIGQETDFGSKTAVEEVTTPTTPGEIVDNTPGTGEEPGTGEQPAEQPAARPEPEEEIEEIPQPAQGAPFGTADQVIEPPIDEMLYEGWMQHILPTLDRAEKQMLNMEMPSDKSIGSMLSKEDQTNLRKYLGQVYSDISNEKMGAINHAMARRDFSLLNYANRTGFDTIAGGVFPYQFWFTRSALNWFARIATDPKILADYMRLTNFAIDAEDREGYPQRLKGKIGIPMPFLPDWMGKTAYIDPFRQIYPFQQLAAPFKRMQDENNLVNKKAAGYVQQALEDGRITDAQAREALENKRGDVWEDAIMDAKAAEDLEFKNPLDFAFAVASPSLPASLIYQFSPWGDKDKIGQLPITRTIQATTSMLGIGGARGLNIEEPFRKAAGMNSIDRYEEYRVNRELSNMVAEGLIDSETAILAMIDQKGDVYEQAQVRVAKQMNPRTFLSSVGLDFFPEGESEMRNLSVEYGKALEAKYEDGDEDALNKFWDTYPEYEARIASNNSQEPDKILNTFLRSRIWQAYNQMNGYEKNQVREGFGDLFSTAFLNKETRNYNAISTETLAAWARSLGANMPEQYANMPEIPGSTIPDAENKMLDQFVQERDQLFPGISELQEQLYALDPDSQELFRKNNPMLNEYSDWRNRWIADHPQSAQYLTGDQSELYGLPTEIQAAVYGYRADVAEYFPGIYDIQSQYFAINSSNKKSAFLKTHPELPAYWDYRREYAAAYPQAAPYILSDESLAKYILGEDRSPQTSNIAVPQAQDLDPALLRLLASYFISGKELSSGARAELNRLWKSAGSPAGSMENWLHAYVIPNLKK